MKFSELDYCHSSLTLTKPILKYWTFYVVNTYTHIQIWPFMTQNIWYNMNGHMSPRRKWNMLAVKSIIETGVSNSLCQLCHMGKEATDRQYSIINTQVMWGQQNNRSCDATSTSAITCRCLYTIKINMREIRLSCYQMAVRSLGACNRSTYHVPPSRPLSNTVTVQACASGVSMVASNTRDSERDLQNTYVYLFSGLLHYSMYTKIMASSTYQFLDITHKPVRSRCNVSERL